MDMDCKEAIDGGFQSMGVPPNHPNQTIFVATIVTTGDPPAIFRTPLGPRKESSGWSNDCLARQYQR